MTVDELIRQLQALPDFDREIPIVSYDREGFPCDGVSVRVVETTEGRMVQIDPA